MGFSHFISSAWYRKAWWLIFLRPLSILYGLATQRRRRTISRRAFISPIPVLVVGNITTGGAGKTPLLIAILNALKQRGYTPGVISRGYKSRAPSYPYIVKADDVARVCGDEPLLIAQRCQCPVVIASNRKKSIGVLLSEYAECDVIISDDGLQHYAMHADIKICVVDSARGWGNSKLLPEGPLREPLTRLADMDAIVVNAVNDVAYAIERNFNTAVYQSKLEYLPFYALGETRPLEYLMRDIYAVAGIAHPHRFFSYLRDQGFSIEERVFADHHDYCLEDFATMRDKPIVMTEKDAVKCRSLGIDNAYYLPIAIELPEQFLNDIHVKLKAVIAKRHKR